MPMQLPITICRKTRVNLIVRLLVLFFLLLPSPIIHGSEHSLRLVQLRDPGIESENLNWQKQLKAGQVIVTESPVTLNIIYLLLYPEFSTFVHTGILDVEGSQVYVYESTGMMILGFGSGPSTDHISGRAKKTPLNEFLSDVGGTVSIYDVPANIKTQRVLAYAKQQVANKTPFDPYFDYADHSKLYCSEFVALALEAGGNQTYSLVAMKPNASTAKMSEWLKLKSKYILPVNRLIQPENWVATISQQYTLTELKLDRAIKAEIYQRFTPEQKLGNVLAWRGLDANFQPTIERFREAVFNAFTLGKDYPTSEILGKVKKLAALHLGEFEHPSVSECKIDFSSC